MVPGHVQGLSRAPPGQPGGGEGEELDSKGLWGTPEVQSLKSKVRGQKRGSARGKAVRWKATQSHLRANCLGGDCDPQATHTRPASHLRGQLMRLCYFVDAGGRMVITHGAWLARCVVNVHPMVNNFRAFQLPYLLRLVINRLGTKSYSPDNHRVA